MRRRGWKRGDWLIRDEESGFTEYASKLSRDYYGVLTRNGDRPHPQSFVIAKKDPYPVPYTNPPVRVYNVSAYVQGTYVGVTDILAPVGAATHLYNPAALPGYNPGIGEMEIGTTFIVQAGAPDEPEMRPSSDSDLFTTDSTLITADSY